MLMRNPPRKAQLHMVFTLVMFLSVGIVMVTNRHLVNTFTGIFIASPPVISSSTPCTSVPTVLAAMRNIFESSGRSMSTKSSPFSALQDDESFNQKNLATTLSKISSMFMVEEVVCKAIINGSDVDTDWANKMSTDVGFPICDDFYIDITADCKLFQAYRGYIMSPLTKEEEDFPLAFSLIVYKDVEMVERLLRTIYRPQNYYCIHVDKKSNDVFFRAISDIANCFPNVFVASRRVDVRWGKYSVLEPELLCMEELWRFPKWKYFLTLTGQEFPLKTNYEMVRILTAFRGANDVMTTRQAANVERWKGTLPPHGLRPVKGSVHITVNRDFVDYILHNETARALLMWTKTTDVPDETYFAILNANPQLGIRGVYKGEPEMIPGRPFISRYKNWKQDKKQCAGRYVRDICIFTAGDLPILTQAKQFFANKFFLNEDRVVIGCLEEMLFNNTRDEFIGLKKVNTSYYSDLEFVKNQVL